MHGIGPGAQVPGPIDRKELIMGMNVSSGGGSEPDVMVDINTTPLIDVMLVLLIMLIITIPIQTHAIKMNQIGRAHV